MDNTICVDLNGDWEICNDLYHREGHLYVFVVQQKSNHRIYHVLLAESLWSNENHNKIIEYLNSKGIRDRR